MTVETYRSKRTGKYVNAIRVDEGNIQTLAKGLNGVVCQANPPVWETAYIDIQQKDGSFVEVPVGDWVVEYQGSVSVFSDDRFRLEFGEESAGVDLMKLSKVIFGDDD